MVVFLLFQQQSIAQKNDYIVIRDSIFTEGKVKDLPSDENSSIYFRKVSREEFKKYSIEEVNELMFNRRKFFRKTIQLNDSSQMVFLELLPQEMTTVKLWQLNQEKEEFFIEISDQLILLDKSYPLILKRAVENPELERLISITNLNWYDLTYLFNTAKRYKTPRTYTPIFVFTPYAGISFTSNQFTIPNSSYLAKVKGIGPTVGFNAEAFLNFKRNISFNLSPSWSAYSIKSLLNYNYVGFAFESDVFLEYSTIQIPVTAKYYFDLRMFLRFLKLRYKIVDLDITFEKIDISDIDVDFIKKVNLQDLHAYISYVDKTRNNKGKLRLTAATASAPNLPSQNVSIS